MDTCCSCAKLLGDAVVKGLDQVLFCHNGNTFDDPDGFLWMHKVVWWWVSRSHLAELVDQFLLGKEVSWDTGLLVLVIPVTKWWCR